MSTSPVSPALLKPLTSEPLPHALQVVIDHFGCQAGTLHLYRNGELQLAASAGIPPHIVQIVKTVPIGKGIAGLAAERRLPITICNLQTDTSGQARPEAKTTGMEGSIAVPMFAAEGNELRGVLGIAKATAHDWTEQETAELQRFANLIASRPVLD